MKVKSVKLLSLLTALLIAVCSLGFSSFAEEEILTNTIKRIASIEAADNDAITIPDGYDHGYTTTITAVQNSDGTYCLCVQMRDSSLSIIELNSDYSVKGTLSVPLQLEKFVAFCKDEAGTYYVLYNRELTISTRNSTSLRLVNLDAGGNVIRTLDMSGMASGSWLGIAETNCGNNTMTVNDSYLTAYIARDMFPVNQNAITGKDEFSSDGTVHQASYAFAVDLETFTLVEVENSTVIPYASHSFHQMILKDGNDFVYVDRGDAEPARSYHLTKMSGGLQWKELQEGDSFIFKGEYAENNTYGQLGGIIRSGSNYMLVGSYENTTASTEPSAANIFVQMFDVKTLAPQKEFYLTAYTGTADEKNGFETVTNPKLIRANEDCILIPYMLSNHTSMTDEMHVILADNNGEVIWDKAVEYNSDNPALPRFGQVYFNSDTQSIVWFTIVNSKLIVNSVEIELPDGETTVTAAATEEATTAPQSGNEPVTDTVTTVIATETTTEKQTLPDITAPGTTSPDETTEPEQTTDETKLTFWDRIVNFFVGIYNFFASLFT